MHLKICGYIGYGNTAELFEYYLKFKFIEILIDSNYQSVVSTIGALKKRYNW